MMDLIERAAEKLKQASGESLVERAVEKIGDAAPKPDDTAAGVASESGKTGEVGAKTAAPTVTPIEPAREARSSRQISIDLDDLSKRGFIVLGGPQTRIAEEFRIIKRQLLLKAFGGLSQGDRSNIIMVTSAQPGEGKTFSSINLAMSIASERDLTVLLIDADVARPQLLKTLGVEAGTGLVDAIVDNDVTMADCLLRTNVENLTLLPAGKPHPLATELLASERMGQIIDEIAKRYSDRVVIFDSPPVLASSATSVLALHVGQVLFVVETDRTKETQVTESLSLINGCKDIKLMLNKAGFDMGKDRFGAYYGYDHA